MRRAGLILALAAAVALPGTAAAQPKPTASASAAPTAQPKKEEPKKDAADAGAAPSAPAQPQNLPPGHPRVDNDDEGEAMPPGMFRPPQDIAMDDASLPAGVIVVTIKDADNKPIPRAPVTLSVTHSSVAKGESRERKTREADENGAVRFEGLAVGTGHSYQVQTGRSGAVYAAPPVGLGDKAGKRVVVHAYETSSNLEGLTVGMQTIVFVALREDSIQLEQVLNVLNLGKVSWSASQAFELPRGFKAFAKQEATGEGRVEEVPGGAALRGTFPPGRSELDFRYQVPLEGDATQTIRIRLPPHVAVARVMAESSKSMGLRVAGFPEAQRTEGRDGKRLLITELQANTRDGLPELEITLSGLPTPDSGRLYALVAAVLLVAAGAYYLLQRREDAVDEDARQDLIDAREALLGEIVALERAFKTGEVGPKTYGRVRASLLDALARIVNMLDEADKARKPGRRARAARA